MPTRSQPITQAHLTALAALANANLLPIVNANINPSDPSNDGVKWHGYWSYVEGWGTFPDTDTKPTSFYDKDGGNYSPLPAGVVGLAYPQPDYSFATLDAANRDAIFDELNRIYGDLLNVIFGHPDSTTVDPPPTYSAWTGAEGIYLSQDALVSGPWCVGVNDPVTYNVSAAGLGSLLTEKTQLGELAGTVNGMVTFKNVRFYYSPLEIFNDLTVSSGWRLDYSIVTEHFANVTGQGTQSLAIDFEIAAAGQLTAFFYWAFSGTPGTSPDLGAFTLTDSSGLVAWEIRETSSGHFLLVAKLDKAVAVSDSISLTLTALAPAGYPFDTEYYAESESAVRVQSVSRLIFAGATNFQNAPVLHPNGQGAFIQAADVPSTPGFTLNASPGLSLWVISDAAVKGVWVANTLPTPGLNVYLDQDMPPFVGKYASDYAGSGIYDFQVAVGPNWFNSTYGFTENPPDGYPSGVGLPYASSMRQFAQMQFGTHDTYVLGYLVNSEPNYNVVNEALQPQPTPYLCRRDTDAVPFNLGFNPNDFVTVTTASAAAGRSVAYLGGVVVGADCTGVKIRLVKPGKGMKGWYAGQIGYGEPLAETLEIYVSKSDSPVWNDPATYDFMITGNEVTIPGDGGTGYLASILNAGFNFAVLNPGGSDVAFDVLIEKDIGPDLRQFFPVSRESFSYNILGTPGKLRGAPDGLLFGIGDPGPGTVSFINKPVPQSGYCIFKVRATRLPAANAAGIMVTPANGAPLAVTIGQNVLQLDGTLVFKPFSSPGIGAGNTSAGAGNTNIGAGGTGQDLQILIPADAGTSGDIEVFWPVLAGNELVWQCDEQVVFEAWVNWQPIFHNQLYGLSGVIDGNGILGPKPTAFKYALSFINFFDTTLSGYLEVPNPYAPDNAQPLRAQVQFPLSIDLYNDLTRLLALL